MRPSPWSLGFIMIVVAGGSLLFANSHGARPTATALVAAAALAVGGIALFLRRRPSFWIALGGALVTVAFAIVSFALGREVGLPLPPILALVLGLYICFRLVLARSSIQPAPPKDPEEPAAD